MEIDLTRLQGAKKYLGNKRADGLDSIMRLKSGRLNLITTRNDPVGLVEKL